MKLVRLEITRLPGIEGPLVLDDVAEGCNLVTGPNASGKSSLIRALSRLLDDLPGEAAIDLELRALFRRGEALWEVVRRGREVSWTVDGRRAERPSLPDGDELRRYRLDMESLMAADDEERLFGELRRSLRGGYDLDGLRGTEPFRVGPRLGTAEARDLVEARRSLREVQRDFSELERAASRLPELRAHLEKARRAGAETEALAGARELLRFAGERRQAEVFLESFPSGMERLVGDEGRRLEALEKAREATLRAIELNEARLREAERRIEATGLAEAVPGDAALAGAAKGLDAVRRLDDELRRRKREREASAAAEAEALAALGGNPARADLRPEVVSEAEKIAAELHGLQERRRCREVRLAELPSPPDEECLDALFEAVDALREWLAADKARSPRLRPALISALLGLLAVVASLYGSHDGLPLIAAAVALAGLCWALFESSGDGCRAARERFEAFAVECPEAWRREEVRRRLKVLEAERARQMELRERALQGLEMGRDLERIEGELEEAERRKRLLAEEIGFDPSLTGQGFHLFVRLSADYGRFRRERLAAEADCLRLQAERESALEGVRSFLESWCRLDGDFALPAAEAALEDLSRRGREAREALSAKEALLEEARRLTHRLDEEGTAEKALYEGAGLAGGERGELLARLERRESWREGRSRLLEAQSRERLFRELLESRPDLLSRVESGDGDGIERDLEEAERLARSAESLGEEIARIDERTEAALRGKRLEEASAAVDEALASLRTRRDQAFSADLAALLLDEIEGDFRTENEPELLREARELLGRFTGHAFELRVDLSQGFLVRDCSCGIDRSLPELSTATRMQLLLAMRLAWIAQVEKGKLSLPLFLDEALTNSDAIRFGQVACCLDDLAREGRQIFYLSARSYEAALWKEATGRAPHRIDLEALRGKKEERLPEAYLLPASEPVPEPGERSAESYGAALSAAPVDPRSFGALHLFYILRDDLELLHRLMEDCRLSSLGALELFLSGRRAPLRLGEESFGRLDRRVRIARAWCAAWLQGRGRIVDGAALEASGAVSPRYIDRAGDLARECGGDGALLVAALRSGELSRFRSENIDQLEAWLRAEGYIDAGRRLDAEERRQAVASVVDEAELHEINAVVDWLEAGRRVDGDEGENPREKEEPALDKEER